MNTEVGYEVQEVPPAICSYSSTPTCDRFQYTSVSFGIL